MISGRSLRKNRGPEKHSFVFSRFCSNQLAWNDRSNEAHARSACSKRQLRNLTLLNLFATKLVWCRDWCWQIISLYSMLVPVQPRELPNWPLISVC